jgi:hypothetical protein
MFLSLMSSEAVQRPNSLTESRQKSSKFSSLLFTVTSYCSFALKFLFLQTTATSYSFYNSVTLHCKGERRKTLPKNPSPAEQKKLQLVFNKYPQSGICAYLQFSLGGVYKKTVYPCAQTCFPVLEL